MAISGGAIVPLIMEELVGSGLVEISYIVPLACFVYHFILSLKVEKKSSAV